MKKILLIFLSSVVLITTLVVPCFASLGDSFNNLPNLIDEYSTINVLVNGGGGLEPFYLLDLEPNTTYSFISTKGVERVLCSPVVDNINFLYPCVYTYDTYNLATVNSFTVTVPSYQPYAEQRISGALPVGTYHISYEVDSPIYNISSVFGTGSQWYMLAPSYNTITSANRTVTGTITITQSMVNNGQNYIYIRPIEGASAVGVTASSIKIFLADEDESNFYIPTYSKTFYKDTQLFVYSFTTPSTLSGQYALGFKDSTLDNDYWFDRDSSEDNIIYLVKGSYSMDSFIEDAFGNGYDTGYDDGYKIGENDGLSSASMLRSIIFTILSAPFVIVSNVLDFELLGINIYNLVKVSITILLIAWVITRLKGRE